MLGIKRRRGANQSFEVMSIDGRKLKYHTDGSIGLADPTCDINESNGRVEVNITARDFKELKRMIPGIVRKHPKLSQDKLLQMATMSKEPSPWFWGKLDFGGGEAGKSIIKTCLAMLYRHGLNIDQCEHAHSYLLKGGEPCFGYFNERDLIGNRPSETFLHCVWIRGDSLQKQIAAYVEYFGVQRIVACLSSVYAGDDFSCGYAIDPVTGKNLDLEVDVDILSNEIRGIYDRKMVNPDITKRAIEALFSSWMKIDRQRSIDKAADDAISHALSECGITSLAMVTSENFHKFSSVISDSLTEWARLRLR